MAPLTATAEAPSLSPSIEERAVRATLACVARHGLAKTTFDDVAREAGCARATLYRYFGGKRQLVRITVAARGGAHRRPSVRDAGDAESTFEDAVVAMVVRGRPGTARSRRRCSSSSPSSPSSCSRTSRSTPATASSPGPASALAPALTRFLPPDAPTAAGEWLARVVLTHALSPDTPDRSDRRSRGSRPGARVRAARSPRFRIPVTVGGTSHGQHARDPGPRRSRRPRGDPRRHQHRRRTRSQHLVKSNGDAIFTWDYDRSRPALGKLYERAKKSQWNAQTDLPWDTDVDQEHVVLAERARPTT